MAQGLDTYARLRKKGLQPVGPPVAVTEFERREVKLFDPGKALDLEQYAARASAWAVERLRSDAVILDTETTGVDVEHDRVVQVAVIDMRGRELLDTLVDPGVPIPPRASDIHGITDRDVAGRPVFAEILPRLTEALGRRPVVVYNSRFDGPLLRAEVARVHGAEHAEQWTRARPWKCAMTVYSWYRGQWNVERGDWRWHRLPNARHGALGDCRATLALLHEMAAGRADPDGGG